MANKQLLRSSQLSLRRKRNRGKTKRSRRRAEKPETGSHTPDCDGSEEDVAGLAVNGDCTLGDCNSFTIDVGDNDVTERGEDAYVKAGDNLPAVTSKRETPAAAAHAKHFSASDVHRQKPFELPSLRAEHTARTVELFTTSASSVMERSSRNKPITSLRKLPDHRTEQKQPRNALTCREKVAVASVKRRKWLRGVAGAKRYTNNGKAKRDTGPVKFPAALQPYLSDPTRPSVLPPDVSSLRWEYALEDPQDEADRLIVYKTNRRKRYLAAANKALDKFSAIKRTASPATSSLTSLSSPAEFDEAPRTLTAPRPDDAPGLLPRIPGVDRLYPARTATPKLLVGCS